MFFSMATGSFQSETRRNSHIACTPCRKSKRKCDRTLPTCGLCIRRAVACGYPARQTRKHLQRLGSNSISPSSPISPERYSESEDHEYHSVASLTAIPRDTHYLANAVYFISPELHHQAQLELPRPDLSIPSSVSSLVGEASSIRSIASSYFTTIHLWLPIISKQVFYSRLLSPLAGRRTELSLLTLSMKLCCTAPPDEEEDGNVKSSLYYVVKRLHGDVESAGFMSIHVLQAGILIALYELGQAIYPAAYLTIGACARYGVALGINKFILASNTIDYELLSRNDIEEKRRVWWAVLFLDRFLNLSNPTRPLSTEDPAFNYYLPVDDPAWDDSMVNPADATLISNGFTLKMGVFARLAQSTYLLSQALQSLRFAATGDEIIQSEKVAQLLRTLLALVHTADAEATIRRLEFCAQSGLSFGTILLLQEYHLSTDLINGRKSIALEDLWQESRTTLDRLSAASVSHLAHSPHSSHASDNLPISMIHVIFQAACVLLLLGPGTLGPEVRQHMENFRSVLRLVNLRWRIAGVFLKILETREVATSRHTLA